MNFNSRFIIDFIQESLRLPEFMFEPPREINLSLMQKKFIENFSRNEEVVVLSARNSGKTTLFAFLVSALLINNSNLKIGYIGLNGIYFYRFVYRIIQHFDKVLIRCINERYVSLKNDSILISEETYNNLFTTLHCPIALSYNKTHADCFFDIIIIDESCLIYSSEDVYSRYLASLHIINKNNPYGIIISSAPMQKNSWFYRKWNNKEHNSGILRSKMEWDNIEFAFGCYNKFYENPIDINDDVVKSHQYWTLDFVETYDDVFNIYQEVLSNILHRGYKIK